MYGIQGQTLEISVVGGRNLKDTEWLSKQDPYVVIEYGNQKFRTKTHTDGGKNPSFNDKFTLSLIEGLRELNVHVWNSNTVNLDDLIGSGRVQLEKAISTGFDDSSWALTTRSGKNAGELKLILHFGGGAKAAKGDKGNKASGAYGYPPEAVPGGYPPQAAPGGYPPQAAPGGYPQPGGYAPQSVPGGYPPQPVPGGYPPQVPTGYPPQQSGYPPQQSGYPPQQSGYPPQQSGGYQAPPHGYPPAGAPPTSYGGSSSAYQHHEQKPAGFPYGSPAPTYAAHVPAGYSLVAAAAGASGLAHGSGKPDKHGFGKPDKHGGGYGHSGGGDHAGGGYGHGHYSHGKQKKHKSGKMKGWKGFKKVFK